LVGPQRQELFCRRHASVLEHAGLWVFTAASIRDHRSTVCRSVVFPRRQVRCAGLWSSTAARTILQARGASAPEYEDHRSTVSVEVAGVGPLTPQRHPGLQWRCQYEAGRQRAEGQRKSAPVPSSTSSGTVLHHHRLFLFFVDVMLCRDGESMHALPSGASIR
jgi:hypothetical protein